MGVPSYFAYIIKNHPNIIKNIITNQYHRLYMDCNSILYDSFYEIKNSSDLQENEIYDILLAKTVDKIEKYIYDIRPLETVFIAFDGVAPFAKMEQQRNRRYKGRILLASSSSKEKKEEEKVTTESDSGSFSFPSKKEEEKVTTTTSIFTPGTKFMNRLSEHMEKTFLHQENKYHLKEILLATPKEAGEGEHKLYVHLRQNPATNQNIAIYGLDADLIMLSIFHLTYAENLFVFREAPEFMKSSLQIDPKIKPNEKELWCLDIAKLGRSIANEMACSCPDNHRMYDYVFLCFFLGNDFLPHFPALNIRTQGITRLLDTYRATIGSKQNSFLISKTTPHSIVWANVSKLLFSLAKNEKVFILQEYALRKKGDYLSDKYERMISSSHYGKKLSVESQIEQAKEREDMIQSVPMIFRQEETYICPSETGWESRYYDRFFSCHFVKEKIKTREICENYLEGLEWVLKYYIQGCPDWRWKYKYTYPPLLVDLAPMVPSKTHMYFSEKKVQGPTTPFTQLACVLPRDQLHLLPEKYRRFLLEKHPDWYPDLSNIRIQWAFCKYLWESHLLLPEISVDTLEKEFAIL
jgi:5'-3' exonuclease